jgi:hypothetical protein
VRVGDRLTIAGIFEPVQNRIPVVSVKNRDGNVIIGGTLINSSVLTKNTFGSEERDVLKFLIELLQRKSEALEIAEDDKDLVLTYVNSLAQAENDKGKLKRLVEKLESLVIDVSRHSPNALSLIEIIDKIRVKLAP